MRSLIICADDFAQSPAIDAGITHLIQENRISATSCMTLSPRWKQSAQLLTAEIKSKADIGLHLDFTHFGDAYNHPALILRSILHCLPVKIIRISIHQQLDSFEEAIGSAPDYVDGHQHVHQLPQIREVLLEVLHQRYSHHLPWIRVAKPPATGGFKGNVIRLLGANTLEQKARNMGFHTSGDLLGVYDFTGNLGNYEDRLRHWISAIGHSSNTPVLMCHPAIAQPDCATDDPIYLARLNEFLALSNKSFDSLLQTIKLVRKP